MNELLDGLHFNLNVGLRPDWRTYEHVALERHLVGTRKDDESSTISFTEDVMPSRPIGKSRCRGIDLTVVVPDS